MLLDWLQHLNICRHNEEFLVNWIYTIFVVCDARLQEDEAIYPAGHLGLNNIRCQVKLPLKEQKY